MQDKNQSWRLFEVAAYKNLAFWHGIFALKVSNKSVEDSEFVKAIEKK